ncbi:hypothetical protein CR513_01647, partial [Mucuna pruriens]
MVMKEDGIMDSASSKSKSSSISKFDASCEYSPNEEGDLLVVRCLMNSQPYKLQWLHSKREIMVSKQYDHKVIHDGVTNIFTFVHRRQKLILKPLSPKEVNEDQAKIKLRKEKKSFTKMLESFQRLFPKKIPYGLPPIRGIKHQINFIMGATLLNQATYRANLEENKEI